MAIINGDAFNNILVGTNAADTIDGGLGADSMSGLKGNDIYIVDNAGDNVIELAGEGTDLVKSSVSYALALNVENLTLTGGADLFGIGNESNNVMTGNGGSNVLSGNGGNDRLIGGAGDDYLDGGLGNDIMIGGTGNDFFYVDNAKDKVSEAAGGGHDSVVSNVSFSLAAFGAVEDLYLNAGTGNTNATGNALGNKIGGNESNNDINGGKGADDMYGAGGNDTYHIDNLGDTVNENSGKGTHDTVISTIALTSAIANIEEYDFQTSAPVNFTGSIKNETISGGSGADIISGNGGTWDNLNGNAGNDQLTAGGGNDFLGGGAGSDVLVGGAGWDFLEGGAGVDVMIGGIGNDAYSVDNVKDKVVEAPGEGHDYVSTEVTLTSLWDNVEDVYLGGGNANLSAVGNGLGNQLFGNPGKNSLSGLDGDDAIFGGRGTDVLTGGLGSDTFHFYLDASDGKDTIKDFSGATDELWFHYVGDADGSGTTDFADVVFRTTGVVDLGAGKDVTVTLDTGASITFSHAGTGSVTSLVDLVGTTAQINVD